MKFQMKLKMRNLKENQKKKLRLANGIPQMKVILNGLQADFTKKTKIDKIINSFEEAKIFIRDLIK